MASIETPPQEVSGQVLLWAILALALNGMAQPSRYASTTFGSRHFGEGLLDPQLSSPIYCLLHAVTDASVMVREGWSALIGRSSSIDLPTPTTSSSGQGDASTSRRTLAAHLVLFALAVLPQAIRIFGMRGIPVIQALTAVFLFSAVVQLMSSFTRPRRGPVDETGSYSGATRRNLRRLLVAGLVLGHAVAYSIVWYAITSKLSTPTGRGEDACNLAQWVSDTMIFATVVLIVPWTSTVYFVRWLRVWALQTSPLIALAPFWLLETCIRRLQEADQSRVEGRTPRMVLGFLWHTTVPFVALAFTWSCGVAWVLDRVYKWVSGDQTGADAGQQTTASAGAPVSQSTAAVIPSPPQQQVTDVDKEPFRDMYVSFTAALSVFWGVNIGQYGTTTNPSAVPAQGDGHENPATSSPESSTDSQAPASSTTDANVSYQDPHDRWPKRKTYWKFADDSPEVYQWLHFAVMFQMFRRTIPGAIRESWIAKDANNGARPLRNKTKGLLLTLFMVAFMYSILALSFIWMVVINLYQFSAVPRTIKRLDSGVGWTAFALFNLTTAVLYYTVAFDGSGTVNPGWTSVFGR